MKKTFILKAMLFYLVAPYLLDFLFSLAPPPPLCSVCIYTAGSTVPEALLLDIIYRPD